MQAGVVQRRSQSRFALDAPPAGGRFPWRDDSETMRRTAEPGHIWQDAEDALDLAVAGQLRGQGQAEWGLHVPLLGEDQVTLHPLPNGKYEMVVEMEFGSDSG